MRRSTVAVVLLLAGCGDDGGEAVDGLPTLPDVPELVVVATDFAFEPAALHLVAGEPVNVLFESAQGGHNLSIDAAGFRLPIVDEGESTSGALTIDEPGTYELRCTVPGHADQGMTGTVDVAEPAD